MGAAAGLCSERAGTEALDRDEDGDGEQDGVDRQHLLFATPQLRGRCAEHEQRDADCGDSGEDRRDVEDAREKKAERGEDFPWPAKPRLLPTALAADESERWAAA